ncbi:MAG TPA: hypothetical protein VF707_03385 [Ardenticatenaceae bacterium]
MEHQENPINQPPVSTKKERVSRRDLLKIAAATGGVFTLGHVPSKWSTPLVEVGYLSAHAQMTPVLGTGDLQVTLTWNTGDPNAANCSSGGREQGAVDVDLHVTEPDGTHVYWADEQGTTATLDVDNERGLGPENIFVSSGGAASGTYQIYIAYFCGAVLPTTATVRVRVFANTPQERSMTFTRELTAENPDVGINVASVTFPGGVIQETTGTQPTLLAAESNSKGGESGALTCTV